MAEISLGIERNLNLTTNENLWRFYRGISLDELKQIYNGEWLTLDKFFTTNLKRAENYSFNNEIVVEINYQMPCNWKEQMRIFNKLHKNRDDFYDIICDRDLFFKLWHRGVCFQLNNRFAFRERTYYHDFYMIVLNDIKQLCNG